MADPEVFEITDWSPAFATSMTFTDAEGRMVFMINPGGVLEAGPGLSAEEATQALFDVMVHTFPGLMKGLANS